MKITCAFLNKNMQYYPHLRLCLLFVLACVTLHKFEFVISYSNATQRIKSCIDRNNTIYCDSVVSCLIKYFISHLYIHNECKISYLGCRQ